MANDILKKEEKSKDFLFLKQNRSFYFKKRQKGHAIILAVMFFMFISLSLFSAIVAPTMSHLKGVTTLHSSFEALSMAETGMEDVIYRFIKRIPVDTMESFNLERGSVTVTYDEEDKVIDVLSVGVARGDIVRKVSVSLELGAGVNFAYAVQVGNGGLVMENSSSVEGNVFATGYVRGVGNNIFGSVIVTGSAGYIENITIQKSGHAYRIEDSHIGEDAYYTELISTTVMGDMHPDTDPADPVDFPISEEMKGAWKEVAEAGDVINCSGKHVINSSQTLGPAHITCDLEISGNHTITLRGHVWVEGDIEVKNSPIIKIDASLGDESVVLIADDPSDRLNKGVIVLGNNPDFQGADGSDKSFIFMVSTNESASEGGTIVAVEEGNLLTGDIFIYADKGEIMVRNNINITGLTAYRIRARNSATIFYQDGLADTFFSTGPSAGYVITSWREVE